MTKSPAEIAGGLDDLAAVLHAAGADPGRAEQMTMFGRFIRRRGGAA